MKLFERIQNKIEACKEAVLNFVPNSMNAFEEQKHQSIKAKGTESTYDRYEPSRGYHEEVK